MVSRRSFLFGSLAALTGLMELEGPGSGRAAKKKISVPSGPRVIAKLPWSPAISADFVAAADTGLCCLANEFGRISFVDLVHPNPDGQAGKIIAELSGVGKRVLDFATGQKRAVVLVNQGAETDIKLALIVINLYPVASPSVISTIPINKLTEADSIAIGQDLACVAGTTASGEHIVLIYSLGKGKTSEDGFSSTVSFDQPIKKIDVQNKLLTVLLDDPKSKLVTVSLNNPTSPLIKAKLELPGKFTTFARSKDLLVAAGETEVGKFEAQLVNLRKAPQLVSSTNLAGVRTIDGIVAQDTSFLILAETIQGRSLLPLTAVQSLSLFSRPDVIVTASKETTEHEVRLAAGAQTAYVACGWEGVQTYKFSREGVSKISNYVIPRLPASGVALWNNYAVVASADLSLYKIDQPSNPVLAKSIPITPNLKAIAGAGSFVLCLGRDTLTLRKFDQLETVAASISVTGKHMCFDPVSQTAFILREEKKKTTAQQFRVYSNKLVSTNNFDLSANAARLCASGGYLLVGALNDLTLYKVGDSLEEVAGHHFEDYALRDFAFGDQAVFATAVDDKSRGKLLILTKEKDDQGELTLAATLDLPHDGVALSVSGSTAVAVGHTNEGKDLATVIDILKASSPKITGQLPALESASSVAIHEKSAVIVGRGLEILSTS